MIRHKWEGTKCIVCGISKYTYKETAHDGTKYWKIRYHRDGKIVENTGCIKVEKHPDQLKLFDVPISEIHH